KSTATASWHTDHRTTAGSRRGPAPSRRGGGGQRAGPAGENICTLGGSPRTARAEGRAPCRCPSVFARGVGTCARRVRVYRISRSPDAPSARIVPDTIGYIPVRGSGAQRGLTHMRTPFVKRHTIPRSGVFAFFRFPGPVAVCCQLRFLT